MAQQGPHQHGGEDSYGPPGQVPPAAGGQEQTSYGGGYPEYQASPPPPPGGWPAPYGQPGAYGQPGPYGQPYGGYPYAPPQRTNGMAIASMVLGILWLYWIGSILALVFGYTAKRQIRERGEAGGGMATAGIVLGWIGVGFLVLALVARIAFAVS